MNLAPHPQARKELLPGAQLYAYAVWRREGFVALQGSCSRPALPPAGPCPAHLAQRSAQMATRSSKSW